MKSKEYNNLYNYYLFDKIKHIKMSNLNNISVFSNKLCFTIFLFNKLFLKSRKQDNIQNCRL
jgi:hypothetical protein